MRAAVRSSDSAAVSRNDTPRVTVRTSRLSLSIMRSTSRTSEASNRVATRRLYALERVHDLFVHHQALGAQRLDRAGEAELEVGERHLQPGRVDHDDHGEVVRDQRLRDVDDVAAGLGDRLGDLGHDAALVLAGGGDDRPRPAPPRLLGARRTQLYFLQEPYKVPR